MALLPVNTKYKGPAPPGGKLVDVDIEDDLSSVGARAITARKFGNLKKTHLVWNAHHETTVSKWKVSSMLEL